MVNVTSIGHELLLDMLIKAQAIWTNPTPLHHVRERIRRSFRYWDLNQDPCFS